MKTILFKFITALCLLLSGIASADTSLMASRVTAEDVIATADFYKQAFDLKEVQRLELGDGNVEIMLNFGADVATAQQNPNAQVVIMHREAGTSPEAVPHLIFGVTEIEKVAADILAAGGTVIREPFEFGNTGIKIALFLDPAGNQVELIQQPSNQ